MTGISLLFIIAIWLVIVSWLTNFITRKLPERWWRMPVGVLLFFTLKGNINPIANHIIIGLTDSLATHALHGTWRMAA